MTDIENKEDEQQRTTVVNMHKDEYDVYIGRAGRGQTGDFGNPFDVRRFGRSNSLYRYHEYFLERIKNEPGFKEKVLALKGKRLGCFCAPRQCHGDIIVRWLEEQEQAWEARARKEADQPRPESINKSKKFHLKMLAMKMTPEGITTPMRTPEERDLEQSMEKSLRTKEAQENIGGSRP